LAAEKFAAKKNILLGGWGYFLYCISNMDAAKFIADIIKPGYNNICRQLTTIYFSLLQIFSRQASSFF
jgi:hypothetical protein